MNYQKSQMVFTGYKWSARVDHDNPKIIGAQDAAMLNREEGCEMLYFINNLAKSWNWPENLASRQHLERIIKEKVPTHSGIKNWIEQHYKEI